MTSAHFHHDPQPPCPLFVVGSGRSGTTLLRALLNAASPYFVPPETDFIARAFPRYGHRSDLNFRDYPLLAALFRVTSENDGWGMSQTEVLRRLSKTAPTTFPAVNDELYRGYLASVGFGSRMWAIKRPVLVASIPRIFAVFPCAKIVHVIRDGRDVFRSYQAIHNAATKTFGPKGAVTSALYWVDSVRRAEHYSARVHSLRYEDLLADPNETFRRLGRYLGVSIDYEALASYETAAANRMLLAAAERSGIHSKVLRGIDATNVSRYKELSSAHIAQFELVGAPLLVRLGYSLEYPWTKMRWLGVGRRLAYSLGRLYNNARYRVRDSRMCRIAAEKARL